MNGGEPEAPPSYFAFAHADSAADLAARELHELVGQIGSWLEEGQVTRERMAKMAADAGELLREIEERRELAYQAYVAERLELLGLDPEDASVPGEDERLPDMRNEEAARRLERTWDSWSLEELFQEELDRQNVEDLLSRLPDAS